MLDEITDFFMDGFSYVISFEWLSDGWELITGLFESIGEFSIGGAIFGLLTFVFVYALREYMLNPFLLHMGTAEALFWGGATYLGSALVGYLVGKQMFEG